MAAPASSSELFDFIRKSGVISKDRLERFLADHPALSTDPIQAANRLVQLQLLTAFQAKLLLVGRYRGFRLGAYLLQDQLGQGGMGAVYLAVHDTLRRKAAIKVLPPGGDKLSVERFLREARAAAALDHPNIVRTHDVGRDGEVHFLVMEYVEGQTLDRLVTKGGPLSTQRAVEFIAQAATGLQHAYEKGFIHRDIKPSNLILGTDGTVKILDMGLARSFAADDQLTALLDQGAVVGTADYISPEQAMNDPKVDIRTDIYSLGATFFSILTGRPPFDGPTASKLLQHQMKDAPSLTKLDRTIPKALAQVVAKMMAKKPGDRFQTPADVITALQPWLIETPPLMAGLSQTRAASTGQLSSRNLVLGQDPVPARKKPNWIWAVVGGVVALVLLGVGVALAIALSGSSSQNRAGTNPEITRPTAPPQPPPNPDAKVLLAFEAGKIQPFRAVVDMGTAVEGRLAMFPAGIGPFSYKEGSRGGFRREDYRGRPVIAITNLHENRELRSAQLGVQLETEVGVTLKPGGKYVVVVEYATVGNGSGAVTVQSLDYKNLATQLLPETAGEWKTAVLPFQRDAKTPVRIVIDSFAEGNESALHFGSFQVKLAETGTAYVPNPETPLNKLSWLGAKPVTVRKRLIDDPKQPGKKINKLVDSTGAGALPAGWDVWTYDLETLGEAVVNQSQGSWALGVRNAEGPPTAMLFSPSFTSSTGYCRLRCEVLYTGKNSGAQIRIFPEGQKAGNVKGIEPNPDWQTIDIVLDCRSKGTVKFEFHNAAESDQVLWIRSYEVLKATQEESSQK